MNDPHHNPDQRLSSYDFDLPPELIAQTPSPERVESRLFRMDPNGGPPSHHQFQDIVKWLKKDDLLVVNQTKVIPARAFGVRESTGGRAQALFLNETKDGLHSVLLGTRGRLKEAETLSFFDERLQITLCKSHGRGLWSVRILCGDLSHLLSESGRMPLPPYIRRDSDGDPNDELDRERYQTVFAGPEGAVAAPTAGLHFTVELLDELKARGIAVATVTLHVGIGTFQPIECESIEDHVMHEEWYEIPPSTVDAWNQCRHHNGRVIAVGTTSVRSLESAWNSQNQSIEAQTGTTDLFLYPPKKLLAIDGLITNFHLPKSSLLLLVSCLTGRRNLLAAYSEAIKEGYRFFSYGDAMLIL